MANLRAVWCGAVVAMGLLALSNGQGLIIPDAATNYMPYPGYGGNYYFPGGYQPYPLGGTGGLVPIPPSSPPKKEKPKKSPSLAQPGLGSGANLAVLVPGLEKQILRGFSLGRSIATNPTLTDALPTAINGLTGLIGR